MYYDVVLLLMCAFVEQFCFVFCYVQVVFHHFMVIYQLSSVSVLILLLNSIDLEILVTLATNLLTTNVFAQNRY